MPDAAARCTRCGQVADAADPARSARAAAVPPRPAGRATFAPPAGPVVATPLPMPAPPPRRRVPRWSIVTGALTIVVVLIGAVILTRGSGSARSATRAGAVARSDPPSTLALVPTADTRTPRSPGVAAARSLLTLADLGSGWTDLGLEPVPASGLALPSPRCSDARGLDVAARFGREDDFSYQLTADGSETGHLNVTVTGYRTAAEARAAYGGRADPSFAPCAIDLAARSLDTPSTDNVVAGTAVRIEPPESHAVTWSVPMTYDYHGQHGTTTFWRAYLQHGRFVEALVVTGPFDQVLLDELLGVADRRLRLNAPR